MTNTTNQTAETPKFRAEYSGCNVWHLYEYDDHAYIHCATIRAPRRTSLVRIVAKYNAIADREFLDAIPAELELLDDEDKSDVSDWETVASYVSTFPDGDSTGACDVEVQIGRSGGGWYLQTKDDAGGSDDCDDTAYETEAAAREAAEECADEQGEAGEDAEKYLARHVLE